MVTIIDCSGHFFPRDSDRIPDLPDTMASEVGVRDTSRPWCDPPGQRLKAARTGDLGEESRYGVLPPHGK